MRSKKGALIDKEIVEIVLGAVAVFVMVMLLYNLIAPNFDKGEKTSESYLNSFKDEVAVADAGGVGRFSIWQPEKEIKYFLVYFGSKSGVGNFKSYGEHENQVCVCYVKGGKSSCSFCKDLDRLAVKDGEEEKWAVGFGEEIYVGVVDGNYRIFDGVVAAPEDVVPEAVVVPEEIIEDADVVTWPIDDEGVFGAEEIVEVDLYYGEMSAFYFKWDSVADVLMVRGEIKRALYSDWDSGWMTAGSFRNWEHFYERKESSSQEYALLSILLGSADERYFVGNVKLVKNFDVEGLEVKCPNCRPVI
ncbi:MAG: hypothetical protein KJ592_00580 [Nanoarchaeota archaeon]|nr:hypothetical protein [Nanoarchaeota archaeon]